MKPEIHKIRVNVKSLAAESRAIRQEIHREAEVLRVKKGGSEHRMRQLRALDNIADLCSHRTSKVKPESRLAHLALAFLKGVPYKAAENKTKTPLSAADLSRKVKKFSTGICFTDICEWIEGDLQAEKAA